MPSPLPGTATRAIRFASYDRRLDKDRGRSKFNEVFVFFMTIAVNVARDMHVDSEISDRYLNRISRLIGLIEHFSPRLCTRAARFDPWPSRVALNGNPSHSYSPSRCKLPQRKGGPAGYLKADQRTPAERRYCNGSAKKAEEPRKDSALLQYGKQEERDHSDKNQNSSKDSETFTILRALYDSLVLVRAT